MLTVPEIPKDRYYSIQFIDAHTFNFAYVGSRATGNNAGNFLLAGPQWKGDKPPGIKEVIHSAEKIIREVVDGLDESDKTQTNTVFHILPEAECEAIAQNATLRELVRLWSTLEPATKRAIMAVAQIQ